MFISTNLEEYLDLCTYGFTNPMPDSKEGPWKVTAKDVIAGKINFKTARKTTLNAFNNELTAKSKPKINDVLLTKDGTLGRVAIVKKEGICINQSVALLRTNEKMLPQFLYYILTSPETQQKLIADSDGSVLKHIYVSRVPKMLVSVPNINVQKTITHILGSLDDKIELNRQMNETLESMAQALFKSWFVDFDPVIDNALAAGNPIPDVFAERAEQRRELNANAEKSSSSPNNGDIIELPVSNNETASSLKSGGVCFDFAQQPSFNGSENSHQSLFPSEFEFTEEMGWIPKGWAISEIGKLCEKIQNGGTPRRNVSEFWENGTIPWLGSGEVRQTIITGAENKITDLGLSKSSAKWLPAGTTVIAMYGATAGQVAFLANKLTTNQAVCGLISKEGFQYFNYLSLERAVSHFESRATGSAQQNISKGIIEETKVIVPSDDLVEKLKNECEGIFPKWVNNLDTNKTLTKLRDTLLPKLLSGELRILDAEKLIKESVA